MASPLAQSVAPCINQYGSILCSCGNTPDQDGFSFVLPSGEEVEPTPDSLWEDHYFCRQCGHILSVRELPTVHELFD